MLDIEEKFQEGNYREELLESIQAELQNIKEALNSGLNPDDYNKYSKYAMALESSITIMNKTAIPKASTIH